MPGLIQYKDELDKREYLFNIYQTYITKDIKAFLRYYPDAKKAVVLANCSDKIIKYENRLIYFLPYYRAFYLKDLLDSDLLN